MLATSQAGGCANAYALTEQFNDLNHRFMVSPQTVKRLRFRKGFATAPAAVALDDAIDVLEAPEFVAFTATA
jgi:hypothetical protein